MQRKETFHFKMIIIQQIRPFKCLIKTCIHNSIYESIYLFLFLNYLSNLHYFKFMHVFFDCLLMEYYFIYKLL